MNVIEIVREARPEVGPLDPVHRDALRRRLLGSVPSPDATRPGPPAEAAPTVLTSGRRPPRWLAAAAAVLVVATLGAILLVSDRRTPTTSDSPVESSVSAEPVSGAGYTPLALSEPPEGYRLVSARWGTGSGGGGSAVYTNPQSGSRLEVVSTRRDGSQPTVTELGQPTWQVDGYTVTATSTTGCSRDTCGIGLQWDAHTFATLTWNGPEGGELEPVVTIDALLDLVPQLAPSTSVPAVTDLIARTSTTSPVTPAPTTTTSMRPADMAFTPVVLTASPDRIALVSTPYHLGDCGFGTPVIATPGTPQSSR